MVIIHKKSKKKINIKDNLKLYFNVAKDYKWWFIIIVFFAIIVESERLFEKFLVKIVIDNGSVYLAGDLALNLFKQSLIVIGIAFGIAIFLKFIAHWVKIKVLNRLSGQMMYDLKNKFFKHIIKLSHGFHTGHKTGRLISRMTRGINGVDSVTDFLVFEVSAVVLQILFVSAAFLYFDPISALVLILTTIIFLAFGLYVSNKQQLPQYRANYAEDVEKGTMADIFTNIDSVKYFAKEKDVGKRFERLTNDTRKKQIKFWDYFTWFNAGESLIIGIGTFFIFFFPLLKLFEGQLTIGTLAFIYTAYFGLMGTLFGFVHGIRRLYISLGDFDALFEYEKITNEIKDKPKAVDLRVKDGSVEFRNVSFDYHKKK